MRKLAVVLALVLLPLATARAQFCPGVTPWTFNDVSASDPFCGYVTWLAQKGVTLGCQVIDANNRLYCPTDSVRRDQMAAFMSRLGDALFPSTCAAGQVMKWNGAAWTCANDALGGSGGGGTVTSVLAGTGLSASPNPIVGAGVMNLALGYQLPQGCANGQVAKSNGAGGWSCAADNNSSSNGTVTSLTQGSGIVLAPNPIVAAGSISADTAYLQRRVSASCAAGSSIRAIAADGTVICETDDAESANTFVQGGNAFGADAVLGTNDNRALRLRVNGQPALRVLPTTADPGNGFNTDTPNIVSGWEVNAAFASVIGATIGGGGGDLSGILRPNRVTDHYGTVGGGAGNSAGDAAGTADDRRYATVGGGIANTASGIGSTVGGGRDNSAGGPYSTVPGGDANEAVGSYSFAAGRRAKAPLAGTFAWADSTDADFVASAANEFAVRASGGLRLRTSTITLTGCNLPPNSGTWNCTSDIAAKTGLAAVDGRAMLQSLVAMPVRSWRFLGEPADIRHVGPTAQDFRAAFGLGYDDRTIATVDAQGVALAAIQGLNAKVEQLIDERDAVIAAQSREIAELREQVVDARAIRAELVALKEALAELRRERSALAAH